MGKLLEALKRKKAEIDKKRQGKAPNVMEDPAAALQFQKQLADAEFLETRMARGITASLKQMTPEQQDAFYDSCISEERKNAYARNDFHEALDNDWTDFISDGGKFGQDWEKTVSSFEKMISAEENEALAWEVDQLKLPSDPTYPKELRYTNPYKDAIAAQRNLIRDDDPDAAKKKEILDRADEVLLNGSEDTLQNLNRIYTHFSTPKTAGIDAQMDLVGDLQTVNYLDKTLENGRYKNKFPTKVVDGERRYKCQEIDPATTDLTDADIRDLRKTKMDLSPKTVNTVLSVMEKMNKIGEDKFKNPQTVINVTDENGNARTLFRGEQGVKYYAFWPIVTAKRKLGEALQNGNYADAEQALKDYDEAKRQTDGIMQDVKAGVPVFGGNVESTRPGPKESPNGVPLEYLEDTVGHNKANGLFCLYAFCKSYGQKPEEVLNDPIGSMTKTADEFRHATMISGRNHTGMKLVKAFAGEQALKSEAGFDNQVRAFGHGLDAVSALADSKEERERVSGLSQVACGIAVYDIRKERKLWEDIAAMDAQKANVIYTHAALLPEDEFDLVDLGRKLKRPGWRAQLDTDTLITRLKNEGKLDLGRLATHVQHVMEDADRMLELYEKDNEDSNYSPVRLLKAATSAYRKVLKQASEEEKETAGYAALKKTVGELRNKMWEKGLEKEEVEQATTLLDEKIDILAQRKTGFLMSTTDSAEHRQMMRHLTLVKYKLKQLRGEEIPEVTPENRKILKEMNLTSEISKAREATYEYYRLKTDNGGKDSFTYTAGANRANAALTALDCLDVIEEAMELSDPIRQEQEKIRKAICVNEDGEQRNRENVSRAAAKMIYLMHVGYKNMTQEDQRRLLAPERMDTMIQRIQASPEFLTMMRQEGHKNIANYIAEGKGKFTDACIRADNVIKRRNGEAVREPSAMTREEKEQMWAQHQIPEGPQA